MNQKIKRLQYFISFLSAFSPIFVFSASIDLANSDLGGVIRYLIEILALLNPILFSLAFVVFFWGLSKFILNSGNKDEIEKGKNYMMWGIIALFILVSFRVIISFVSDDLGLGNATIIPKIQL